MVQGGLAVDVWLETEANFREDHLEIVVLGGHFHSTPDKYVKDIERACSRLELVQFEIDAGRLLVSEAVVSAAIRQMPAGGESSGRPPCLWSKMGEYC